MPLQCPFLSQNGKKSLTPLEKEAVPLIEPMLKKTDLLPNH